MTDYEPENFAAKCPSCGEGHRMYWGDEGAELLMRLPVGKVKHNPDLDPGYAALATQIRRRMDRLRALYEQSYTADRFDVLDEVDALFVSIYHMWDWLRVDPEQAERVTKAEVDALYDCYPLEITRAYANTYKHLILDPDRVTKRKPYRLYARVESYVRDGKNAPVVMIRHWAVPAGDYHLDGSVEALQLANECLDALVEFGKAHGDL